MDTKRLGRLFASRRKASVNPHTGEPWTQEEIARQLHVARETISHVENGQLTYPLQPETANVLTDLLGNLSVLEIVQAMGYQVGNTEMTEEEQELVELYRRLAPVLRAPLLHTARALRDSNLPAELSESRE